MNIRKVIKFYALFLAISISTAIGSQSPEISNSAASVLNAFDRVEKVVTGEAKENNEGAVIEKVAYNSDVLEGFFNTFTEYLFPGKEAVVAKFYIQAKKVDCDLDYLKIKMSGDNSLAFENIYLTDSVVSQAGFRNGEYFEFKNLDSKILQGQKKEISIMAEVSQFIKTGKIVKLSIENSNDVKVSCANEQYDVANVYPVSIANDPVVQARSERSERSVSF